jgi:nitroreductase
LDVGDAIRSRRTHKRYGPEPVDEATLRDLLASYWRTPACFGEPAVRELLGLGADERVVALIHLGPPAGEPPDKDRLPLEDVLTFLP